MLTKGVADVSRTTRRSDNEWREKSCCRAALMAGGQHKTDTFTGFGVFVVGRVGGGFSGLRRGWGVKREEGGLEGQVNS